MMSPQEFEEHANRIKIMDDAGMAKEAYLEGVAVMCGLLRSLGYGSGVDTIKRISKIGVKNG